MGSVLSSVKYTPDGLPYHNFDDFTGMKKIGNGGYGTVYKAKGTLKGFTLKKQTVAIKSFNAIDDYSKREIEILKTRTHPNIVQLFGVIWDGDFTDSKRPICTGYVMEYLELGSLHRVIYDSSEKYDMRLIKTWIRQIATGLQYLHENGIIHRDVKPQNILLAARDHLKLADFGLARTISGNHTYTSGNLGTDPYMAPEVIAIEKNYGAPADIYSFGVTMWEIASRRCLQQNVSDRPSISEIIQFELEQMILIIDSREDMITVLSADRSEWTTLELAVPIFVEGSVYLNEEIYIIGGKYGKSFYKLDKNLKWIRLANMNIGRGGITNSCLAWNGYVWVFGGKDKDWNFLKSVERYDPETNKWKLMPDMKHSRMEAAAMIWNDRIIVYGGYTGFETSVDCFNPEDATWAELPNIPSSRWGRFLISYKNKILLMGGIDQEHRAQNEVYELDPLKENPTWKSLPPMKYPAVFLCATVFDDEIYAVGGLGGNLIEMDRVEIFNGDQWRDGPSLPFGWGYRLSATLIPQHLADRLCNYSPE